MFEIFIISIGLVLIIEGILYFLLANRLSLILNKLNKFDPQKIKNISLFMVLLGLCLIYYIINYYDG